MKDEKKMPYGDYKFAEPEGLDAFVAAWLLCDECSRLRDSCDHEDPRAAESKSGVPP